MTRPSHLPPSSVAFAVLFSCFWHLFSETPLTSGQESLNIPSNPKPEFTLANSVLQKATLDKIDRIKKLRDKHQSVGGDHPDMKKV